MVHLQRGRARGEVPGEVSGGRWDGELAAISRLFWTNIVYFLQRAYTLLPLPHEVRTFSSPAARSPRVEAGWSWPPLQGPGQGVAFLPAGRLQDSSCQLQ